MNPILKFKCSMSVDSGTVARFSDYDAINLVRTHGRAHLFVQSNK